MLTLWPSGDRMVAASLARKLKTPSSRCGHGKSQRHQASATHHTSQLRQAVGEHGSRNQTYVSACGATSCVASYDNVDKASRSRHPRQTHAPATHQDRVHQLRSRPWYAPRTLRAIHGGRRGPRANAVWCSLMSRRCHSMCGCNGECARRRHVTPRSRTIVPCWPPPAVWTATGVIEPRCGVLGRVGEAL